MQYDKRKKLINKIFSICSGMEFEEAAMELFLLQSQHNKVYKKYLRLLGADAGKIGRIKDIPCLPVSLFKTQKVLTAEEPVKLVFKSSATGKTIPSRHFVADISLYKASFIKCFKIFYGSPADYCILALLPSYLEREDSSLIYMVGSLIRESAHPQSGFYLNDLVRLTATIKELEKINQKTLLIGVSFALLDLVEKYSFSLKNTIIMETGGMKGKRKELTREELHLILKSKTGLKNIHSEYGMTEMLSQAYSKSEGIFRSPPLDEGNDKRCL